MPWEIKLRNLTFVDPLIAKVMVHASDRQAAGKKMTKVLSEAKLQGPPTNLHFLRDVVSSKCKFALSSQMFLEPSADSYQLFLKEIP